MKTAPVYPMQEVYTCPPVPQPDGTVAPDQPIVTLERDSGGRWWHVIGGKPWRPAVGMEVALPAAPKAWQRFVWGR